MDIYPPGNVDFELVKQYIVQLELDDRDLRAEQFLIAKQDTTLMGFGRIRKHNGCDEYCTLGIVPAFQNKGVGKKITLDIIKVSNQPLYLVCIIPRYFEPYGFTVVTEYPLEMQDKLDYCNHHLSVEETYVVMKYVGKQKST